MLAMKGQWREGPHLDCSEGGTPVLYLAFSEKIYFCFMCTYVCLARMHVNHMCAGAHGGRKRPLDLLEQENGWL